MSFLTSGISLFSPIAYITLTLRCDKRSTVMMSAAAGGMAGNIIILNRAELAQTSYSPCDLDTASYLR